MKNQTMSSETGYGMTDYSRKTSWYQIPDAAREVDTIYIYATEYIMGSFEEGSPDYATLDNEEMLQGVAGEYMMHASAFADATSRMLPTCLCRTIARPACGTRGKSIRRPGTSTRRFPVCPTTI